MNLNIANITATPSTTEWWQKVNQGEWNHVSQVRLSASQMLTYINGVLQPAEPMRLETEERKLHGARYYTVAPINAAHLWPDMMQWMLDNFGPSAEDGVWTPGYPWYANNARFWFRNEADMLLFCLRWGGA